MSSDFGRIAALVPLDAAAGLRERGWEVGDLDDEAGVARWCPTLSEAKALCERDLPQGTAVSWTQGTVIGGFVSGCPGVGPEMGGPAPAFVLWPDGDESHAESVGELAELMRRRMQWLAQTWTTVQPCSTVPGARAARRGCAFIDAGPRCVELPVGGRSNSARL